MDTHGLSDDERRSLPPTSAAISIAASCRWSSEPGSGNELYRRVWDSGYAEQNRRSRAWLERHAVELRR